MKFAEVAHRTKGLNPTEDVDAAVIDRKIVDLTKMKERSPKESSMTVPEVNEPRKRVCMERMRSNIAVKVPREMWKKKDLGKACQKSADAIFGKGMRSPQLKG